MENLRKFIKENITLLDGAMGTMLLNAGTCPEVLNLTSPETVKAVHRAYANSGSDIIYTNTFGANRKKIPANFSLEEIISAAVKNAREASDGKCFIGYDMGPIGQLLEPLGSLKFDEAYDIFKEQAILAQNCGADLIAAETHTSLYEIKALVLAVKENTSLPLFCTMSFEENMRTFQGTDARSAAVTLEALGADAIGINCSLGPRQIFPIAKEILKWTDLPVIVKANAGLPRPDGTFSVNAAEFAEVYKELLDAGVSIIGGCCGTSPEYIAALKEISKGRKPLKREPLRFSAICSAGKAVKIEGVKVIGERLNPSGKKPYKEALLNHDTEFVKRQALEQAEAGADILDINAGLLNIDEAAVMAEAVKAVQSVSDIPLQIDSSSPKAIETALRAYNGKPVVNSVNGDEETLDKILPLVKKYGASVVGLTLDKNGIPKTVEKRIEIALRIIKAAEKYGIKEADVYIDPLTLTAGTEQGQVGITLEALKTLKGMGITTLLGVSNISYGLPERENINAAFLVTALGCGLNLPIINPNSEIMMNAVNAFKVLSGEDKNAAIYTAKYGDKTAKAIQVQSESPLKDLNYCILKGLKDECLLNVRALLEKEEPLSIVNGRIIPALDNVGSLFEKGTLFLPQLMQSAETAKGAFEEIKKKMPKSASKGGKIILATVKGDVHDIGKNIVKTVLENYGFEITDLGKNVGEEEIISAAKSGNVKFIGLSALMTTTVSNMEKIIKAIRASGISCKIMAGGAVLTESYAESIGADYYAKDANAAVRIAKEVFGNKTRF